MKKISLIALAAAATVFGTSAMAADLGGNCCADLEERIAELEATTARKGNRKVSLQVSGQVNTGVLYFDDGQESQLYVTDNDNSSSRFRFLGSAKITSDVSAGFLLEIEAQLGDTNQVTQLTDEGTTNLNIRHASWYLDSKSLGRITVGQTSPATDDIILADAAGCGAACFSDQLIGNALFFRLNDGRLSDLSSNLVTGGSLDTARRNLVRYDSPIFAGAKLVVSAGEDDFWDVALWYANKIGDFKIVGGVGYLQDTDGFNRTLRVEEFKGSISALHEPSGLFGSFAYVNREPATTAAIENLDYYYFNAGIVAKNLVPLGKTVFYGEYARGEGFGGAAGVNNPANTAGLTVDTGVITDAELTVYGFGIVQHIPAAEMEVYGLYKNLELDASTAAGKLSLEDIDIVYTGARIKF